MNKIQEILAYSSKNRADSGLPPYSPFSNNDISYIQEIFGKNIPNDYKSFILQYGDISFKLSGWSKLSPVYDMSGSKVKTDIALQALFSAKGIVDDLDMYAKPMKFYDDIGPRIPFQMLPIAIALGKNDGQILLNLGDKNYGAVWFWDRIDETWGTGENQFLGYVAKDFNTMMNSIEWNGD